MTYHIKQLCDVLRDYAPNDGAKHRITDIEKNLTQDKSADLVLADMLVEGLRFNNWPWSS
jgi:hypothetical protein